MEADTLLDSNILVYAYDASEKEKNSRAREILESCFKGERAFAISIQNLNEFYAIVTGKIESPLKKEDALERVRGMANFRGFKVLEPSSRAVIASINLNIKSGGPYWDCFLAATMLENSIFKICTENTRDFSSFPGITASNPFG